MQSDKRGGGRERGRGEREGKSTDEVGDCGLSDCMIYDGIRNVNSVICEVSNVRLCRM